MFKSHFKQESVRTVYKNNDKAGLLENPVFSSGVTVRPEAVYIWHYFM